VTGRPRDLDWPTRRWLLWGLGAIAVLALIVLFFIWFAGEETTPAEEAAEEGIGPQMEWSIVLTSQTGDTVTLKGDLPDGVTTETWQNDIRILRSPAGTFEWDMNQELPAAVVQIDNAQGCDALNAELDTWVADIQVETGEAQVWQARAFIQHTLDRMQSEGCEIDEDTLSEVVTGGS
jgi:hypothetical protein